MHTQIPESMLERFSKDFAFLASINEDVTALVHKIEKAILNCLRDSIRENSAPQNYQKDKKHGELSYSVSGMGWMLARAATMNGAAVARYSLTWLGTKNQVQGVTYHIRFNLPNSKREHHWSVTQRFMIDRYRWSIPASSTPAPAPK
jgi:hypothetical protein